MSFRATRQFPATSGALADVMDFVANACAGTPVPADDCLRAALVFEELFTNTVHHGYGGDCQEPVSITLEADGADVRLRYEDRAPAYDPFSTRGESGAEATELRPIGGLGLALVRALVSNARYERCNGTNCLMMELRRRECVSA